MNEIMFLVIGGIVGLVLGSLLAYLILGNLKKSKASGVLADAEKKAKEKLSTAESKAKEIIEKARIKGESIKKEKIFQAKEKFLELKAQSEASLKDKEGKLKESQDRLREREKKSKQEFDQGRRKAKEAEELLRNYQSKSESLKKRQDEMDQIHKKNVEMLETISGISAEEAINELKTALKEEAKLSAQKEAQEIVEEAKLNAEQEAKKVVISAIQRIGTEQAVENAVSVFNLESDDVKGRIIGREGRNIRAIEAATGVEIIVDDTPEAIILSCFDPVRREIARLSMHKLVTDGRIHPARIEEVVAKTTKQIEQEIVGIGKRTVIDLGINGLHPELIRIVGRMKYRSSYGQNLLQHSREVANLSATMASELGLNVKLAKRAGLLHDIGKVPEEESELPHAILGMKWAEKFGEKPDVCNAIGAHHDEIEMNCLISPIVQVADSISGARPGARRQVVESYLQRLKDLEKAALGFEGVSKAFALQAGRELRVLVESERVDDNLAMQLSHEISNKIQTEMTYPGQVRVTVIRETRAVNVAR